jgi:hypothetical protein
MHLRAVAAAARIGASLELFAAHTVQTWRDSEGVLHFDTTCHRIDDSTMVQLALDEIYRWRHCPVCTRPHRFPDRIERYAVAVEELQRAKLLSGAHTDVGIAAVRSLFQADTACRRAIAAVQTSTPSAAAEVERLARRIRDGSGGVRDTAAAQRHLEWAAAVTVDPLGVAVELQREGSSQWVRVVETARAALRDGGWEAFTDACGDPGGAAWYREQVSRTRDQSPLWLCTLGDGEREGDLLLWLAARHHVERRGVAHAAIPAWALEVAELLDTSGQAIGVLHDDEERVVEIYAELSHTRSGPAALAAARRLDRAERRG